MKKLTLIALVLCFTLVTKAQIYKAKISEISFFSEARFENIDAKNTNVGPTVLDCKSGKLQFQVSMKAFKFKSGLMEEHFNETYVESEKYPHAKFMGVIKDNDKIDYTKDGVYNVIVEGPMTMHGETKNITASGTLTIKGTLIMIDSKFKMALADYKIVVPAQKLNNIAEVVDVTVKSTLEPLKK